MTSKTETLIKALRILSDTTKTDDGVVNACLWEAAARLEDMLTLIDGAYNIVEIHGGGSPYNDKWKKNWMERARKCGAVPSL